VDWTYRTLQSRLNSKLIDWLITALLSITVTYF